MTVRTDPEGNETKELFDLVDLEGVHVLEIGAGDGRLTWRYAERTAHVTAVEPFEGSVSRARDSSRDGSPDRVPPRGVRGLRSRERS